MLNGIGIIMEYEIIIPCNKSLTQTTLNGATQKILVIFGTRPEAIKMCPIVTALHNVESFDTRVLY